MGVPQLVDGQFLLESSKKPEVRGLDVSKKLPVNWWNIFFLTVLLGGMIILWYRWEPSEEIESVSHLSESVRNNDYHKELVELTKGEYVQKYCSPVASNTDSLHIGFSSF